MIKKMFQPPPQIDGVFPNPSQKCFANLSHDIHTRYLYPGQYLDVIGIGFRDFLHTSLVLEKFVSQYHIQNRDDGLYPTISLSQMCSDVLVDAGQNVYFGPLLSRIDPQLPRTFLYFDKRSWELLFQFPHFLSKEMHASKDKIINALVSYFQSPIDQRRGSAWSIEVLEREMRHLGLSDQEIAKMMMMLYWGQAFPFAYMVR